MPFSVIGVDMLPLIWLEFPNINSLSNIRVIRVMCSARVSTKFIMEAFSRGIDGVLVVGCRLEDCHYISGIYETLKTIPAVQKALEKVGINPERLRLEHTSAAEATKFVEVVNSFTSTIAKLGPLELNDEQRKELWEAKQKKEKEKRQKLQRALTIENVPIRNQEFSRRIMEEGITHLDRC